MSVMLASTRFQPTTLTTTSSSARAPVHALSVGASRPLDPAIVAATDSTTTSGAASAEISNNGARAVTTVASASESVKGQGKARAWLNKIIPEKLIHYDPSKDPRLLAL